MADTDKTHAQPKEKQRRGYSSLDAIDPGDGKKWQLLLSDRKMDYVAGQGRGAAKELAYTVRWAVLNPKAIFRGVRDDPKGIAEDGGLCYVSTPSHAYDNRTGDRRPAWTGEVFLVFVEERVIYNWYWCASHSSVPHLPLDYENRFSEKLF